MESYTDKGNGKLRRSDGYFSGNFKDIITVIVTSAIIFIASAAADVKAEIKALNDSIILHSTQIKNLQTEAIAHDKKPGHDVALALFKSNDEKFMAINQTIHRILDKLDEGIIHTHN